MEIRVCIEIEYADHSPRYWWRSEGSVCRASFYTFAS